MSQILAGGFLSSKILSSGFISRIIEFINPETITTPGHIIMESVTPGLITQEIVTPGGLA